MIHEADERLREWALGVVGRKADVSFAAPADATEGEGVGLYLMDLRKVPATRTGARPPQQIVLRYLTTAWGPDPESAHRLLGEVVFAALEDPDLEIEDEPLDPRLWTALGVVPRPAFVLRVSLRRTIAEKPAPLVREIPVLEIEPMVPLRGQVLGPEDAPLSDVRVEMPSLRVSTRTDREGWFLFPAVPAGEASRTLRLEGKGRAMVVTTSSGEEPVVIRFQPLEE